MSISIIHAEYQGIGMTFDEGAWFNATKAAASFNKRPVDWLALDTTQQYILKLARYFNCEESSLLKTRRGRHNSGTWFHPRLTVPFARWCNIDFSIWCDDQITKIIQGNHPHYEWKKIRHESTASFKVMTDSLKLEREYQGKDIKSHHYMNEAKLINWALSGDFKSIDRNTLQTEDLNLLAKLEIRNSALIGRGMPYDERKVALNIFANDWQIDQIRKRDNKIAHSTNKAISFVHEGGVSL